MKYWSGCGEVDPCLSRAFVAQCDLARDEHGDLLEAWREAIGIGTEPRAAEVIERTMLRSGGMNALPAPSGEG